ncbi:MULTISPECIES: hypothetical protein [unclassified Spiroplasma]|uniref:hypothetical protein n=1 Tax=unclassified Spiroplasma TaxID=2637901 RepID=UPI0030D1431E
MQDQRVYSYQGYIKEMGLSSDNVSDNVNYENNDFSSYVWGSEHQIFYNEVLIQFLNINNNGLPDKINRGIQQKCIMINKVILLVPLIIKNLT